MFANDRKVSHAMVAYQLFRTNLASEETWRPLTNQFRQEWLASQKNRQEKGDTVARAS